MENRQEFIKGIKVLASNYISREYAIDDLHGRDPSQIWDTADIEVWINALPSTQPDRLTDDDFETIRIHLNAHKENLCNQRRWKEAEEYQHIIDRCFIDLMVKKLHGNKDADDAVMDAMKDYLEYEVKEYGNIPDKEDYLDVGFMEECYKLGQSSMEMYSHEWQQGQRKHDDDKIMKLICRAIKAVMDYEWGNDGVPL